MVTNEKYHYLACLDKWLTIDEFFKMEDEHPGIEGIDDTIAVVCGFNYNMYDVCTNPHLLDIKANDCTIIEIQTAQIAADKWAWGVFCCGVMDTSIPASFSRPTLQNEDSAILNCLEYLYKRKYKRDIHNVIEIELAKRRFVQMTLF